MRLWLIELGSLHDPDARAGLLALQVAYGGFLDVFGKDTGFMAGRVAAAADIYEDMGHPAKPTDCQRRPILPSKRRKVWRRMPWVLPAMTHGIRL